MKEYKYFILKLWIFLFFISIDQTLLAQRDFRKTYLAYTKILTDSFFLKAKTDHYMRKEIDSSFTLVSVPYYQFTYNGKIPLNNTTGIQFLHLFDKIGYGVIKKKGKLFGYAEKYWQKKDWYQVSFIMEGEMSDPVYRTEIRLIPAAEKLSATYFFVHFLPYETMYFTSIGFLDKGQLKFIDTSYQVYTLTEFLCKRYGSVEKYIELGQNNQTASDLYSLKIASKDSIIKKANCINIIRNDYQQWAINVPTDTTKVFSLFFREMDSIVKLKKCQAQMLKEKILIKLKSTEGPTLCGKDIMFYNIEISRIISEVLTENQFSLYNKKRRLNQGLVFKANEFLWQLYFVDNNEKRALENLPPDDSEDVNKRIRKDVFIY